MRGTTRAGDEPTNQTPQEVHVKALATIARVGGRAAATGLGSLMIGLLATGSLLSLLALNFGAAIILAAAAAVAIVTRRLARRDARERRRHALSAQIDGLTEAGWTIRDGLDTPSETLGHLAVTRDGRFAFAIAVRTGELAADDLYRVADAAAWLAEGQRYRSVVPVLVGTHLTDIERLEGPVLIVSCDRLVEALDSAATAAAELADEAAPPATAEVA